MGSYQVNYAKAQELRDRLSEIERTLEDSRGWLGAAARGLSGQRGFQLPYLQEQIRALARDAENEAEKAARMRDFMTELERLTRQYEDRAAGKMESLDLTKLLGLVLSAIGRLVAPIGWFIVELITGIAPGGGYRPADRAHDWTAGALPGAAGRDETRPPKPAEDHDPAPVAPETGDAGGAQTPPQAETGETPSHTNEREDYICSLISETALKEEGLGPDTYLNYFSKGKGTDWCVMFAVWTAHEALRKAGVANPEAIVPKSGSTTILADQFNRRNQYISYTDWSYTKNGYGKITMHADASIQDNPPKVGDLILLETGKELSDGPDHTAVVVKVENGIIYTMEGNTGPKVIMHQYNMNNAADMAKIHGCCRPDYANG